MQVLLGLFKGGIFVGAQADQLVRLVFLEGLHDLAAFHVLVQSLLVLQDLHRRLLYRLSCCSDEGHYGVGFDWHIAQVLCGGRLAAKALLLQKFGVGFPLLFLDLGGGLGVTARLVRAVRALLVRRVT